MLDFQDALARIGAHAAHIASICELAGERAMAARAQRFREMLMGIVRWTERGEPVGPVAAALAAPALVAKFLELPRLADGLEDLDLELNTMRVENRLGDVAKLAEVLDGFADFADSTIAAIPKPC